MSHLLENDEAVDQLADAAIAEIDERQAEIKALETVIDLLPDRLLRLILFKITELIT